MFLVYLCPKVINLAAVTVDQLSIFVSHKQNF